MVCTIIMWAQQHNGRTRPDAGRNWRRAAGLAVLVPGLLGLAGCTLPGPGGPDDFPRVTVHAGEATVALHHFARFYGLDRPRLRDGRVTLANEELQLVFTPDSRRLLINGVTVWLHQPVAPYRRHGRLAVDDVRTILDPMLRPARALEGLGHRRVLLDPGHGGDDSGAQGPAGTVEKDWTLRIAREVADRLVVLGIDAQLTRPADWTLTLPERVAMARDRGADLFVSIHFNSAANPEAQGTETFVLTAGGQPSTNAQDAGPHPDALPGNAYDGANQWLGYSIQQQLLQQTGNQDRGLRRARFHVLRDAVSPAVLVECAFLTHAGEAHNLQQESYQRRLADGLTQGIVSYMERIPREAAGTRAPPAERKGRP